MRAKNERLKARIEKNQRTETHACAARPRRAHRGGYIGGRKKPLARETLKHDLFIFKCAHLRSGLAHTRAGSRAPATRPHIACALFRDLGAVGLNEGGERNDCLRTCVRVRGYECVVSSRCFIRFSCSFLYLKRRTVEDPRARSTHASLTDTVATPGPKTRRYCAALLPDAAIAEASSQLGDLLRMNYGPFFRGRARGHGLVVAYKEE